MDHSGDFATEKDRKIQDTADDPDADGFVAPSCAALAEETYPSVYRFADDTWRHGSRVTQVFHRAEDDTYWQANYRLSTDGETNELAEGLATITRVFPHQVMVTQYKTEPQ